MAETYSAGVVTAYGAAVRGGYTGTYEEFCAEQAEFAENAAAVAQAKEDVETMQGQVEQAAATFTGTTVPAAVTTVQEAGAAQVQAVQDEGTMQAAAVETVGAQQKAAVEAAGSDAVDAVETAETAATDAVTAAQTAAVQAVQAESTTQQAAIQTKGQETIDSIPEDYTALSGEVDDLKSALSYPLNICDRITFANGSYKSIGNYNSELNQNTTRIYGQYELPDVIYDVTITPTDANYNFEYALFDANNEKIVSNSSWNTQPFHYSGSVGVKTIRVDVRKSNNANISPTQETGIVIAANSVTNFDQLNAKTSAIEKSIRYNFPTRIITVSNNLGKYNFGAGNGYAGEDVEEKLLEWKRMIGNNKADFVMIQENVLYFDAAHNYVSASALWEPLYPYFASDGGSLGISIKSKYPLSNAQKIAVGSRYVVIAETMIGMVKTAVAVTHLTPGYTQADEETRQSEASLVIEALAPYDHVILGGDFNTSNPATMALFTSAGYTIGNNGYFGAIETLQGESIDNVMAKGFSFYNATASANQAITSDHYPFVAEMLLA